MAMVQRTYLDHNATSPLRPEVAEAVLRALQLPGNASSVHTEGRAARAEMEAARASIGAFAFYVVGEGIEKKKDDFVSEVMAQVGQA